MMRNFGGLILGGVVWQAATIAFFTLMWLAMGADRSFQPGVWEVSTLWACGALVAYAAAGVASGCSCGKVARGGWAPKLLCVLVLALGVATVFRSAGTGVRPEDVGLLEAASNAAYPAWAAWLNAIVGPLAILYGASKALPSGEENA